MKTLIPLCALAAASLYAASPAEIAIRQAAASIQKQPAHYPYYNSLAAAYVRRARETADVQWYAKAEEALRQSFTIVPENFEGLKVRVAIQLGRHEFADALTLAQRLNQLAPDDVAVYGYMVDADIELGNYQDAVAAAQWMLNLREGHGPGLACAALLREIYGNLSGALELWRRAYEAVPSTESEERAWMLAHIAHVERLSGDLAQAEGNASASLSEFPDYDAALAELAQVRSAQKRYAEAEAIQQQRYQAVRRTSVLFELAEAQELAGHRDEAAASFLEFERQAAAEATRADNSNRELAMYYLDHAHQPAKALAIAQAEAARRKDIYTLDAYAWALAGNGDCSAAKAEIDKALQVGVKEPILRQHADLIAQHCQRD